MPDALLRKLDSYTQLSDAEVRAVRDAAHCVRRYGPREDIIHEGDRTDGVNLLLSGFAARYKTLEDGRRQFLAYFVPGDFCDLKVFVLTRMDHSIASVSPSAIAKLSRDTVDDLTARFPRLTRALWWCTLVEEAVTREWLLNVGQRTAYERAAHLFCELRYRLEAVELAPDDSFEFPVTQTELGDTLGLSAVHVNRVLQELRRDGLIAWQGKEMRILDREALERVAMFDPAYLHLGDRDRGGGGREAVAGA